MSTVQIDRLLDTVVKTGGSDLHLTTGRQPTVRLHGGLRNLQTKVLDSDDMVPEIHCVDVHRMRVTALAGQRRDVYDGLGAGRPLGAGCHRD